MAIVGIRRVDYGVHDLAESRRFYRDFGLVVQEAGDEHCEFVQVRVSRPEERTL